MVDYIRDRTGHPAVDRSQRRAQENLERAISPMARDGKEIAVTFDSAEPLTVVHRLERRPAGWLVHSIKGGLHAIVEVSADNLEIVLRNEVGATEVTGKLWIW